MNHRHIASRLLILAIALQVALLAKAGPMADVKSSTDKVVYRIDPPVFTTASFPPGALLLQDKSKSAKVEVAYYNEKFEEVKSAERPGRYGAVARITLSDGTQAARFITLYRTPENVTWQAIEQLKLPVIPADSPEAKAARMDMVGTALIGGLVDGTHRSFIPGIMHGLAKVAPGLGPEDIFFNHKLRDDAWWFELRQRIGLPVTYQHEVHLPDGYASDPAQRWPLILFLHGTGERGDDIRTLMQKSIPLEIARGRKIPAVVVWPQCPKSESWSAPALAHLLDEVSAKYRIDPDRLIVTGQSAGGLGTFALAMTYPDRFAAIAPICGFCNPADAAKLKGLPVWVFHGEKDPLVPVQMSKAMVAAIQQAGGNAHLTIFPETNHEAWVKAYPTDALYTWMLAQRRGQPEVKTPGLPPL